jgi:hypothetical protein
MPDAGCRNTDAGGIGLDAEAQLWVQAINVLAEAVSVLVEAIRMLVRSPANLEALYRVPACPPIYNQSCESRRQTFSAISRPRFREI